MYNYRIFALVDILGFSNYILEKDDNESSAKFLLNIFESAEKYFRDDGVRDVILQFLSDSFLIICPVKDLY